MKKLMKKKVSLFGKEVSVLLVALVAMSVVSAALLGYYGVITGMAIVSQSVVLNGDACTTNEACTKIGAWNENFVAGDSVSDCDNSVKNNAHVEATIEFTTTCGPDCGGIETDVYGVLKLTKKNPTTWAVEGNPIEITYTITGGLFESTGVPADYTLIYYKDNVANDNDVERLTVLGNGAVVSGDIPASDDWNAGPLANYCDGANGYDHYKYCRGAKLWAVPNANIQGGVLVWSNPEDFWFETDLVVYSVDNTITLPAGGGFDFCVDNDFAIDLKPDTYTITTTVDVA